MSRRRWAVGCVLVGLCTGLACGPAGDERGRADRTVRLTVGYRPFLSYSPLFIAQEEGYFAEQGLEVEFVKVLRTSHGMPALSDGKLDVLAGSLNAGLLNAVARGARLRMVADKTHIGTRGPPYLALLARRELVEDGALSQPERLRGLTLVMNRDNASAFFVEKALARFGLSPDDMKILAIPSAARLEALEKGAVDIVSVTEPWLTRILSSGRSALCTADYEVIPGFQFGYIAFGPTLLDKQPEVGRRFMTAYLRGIRQHNRGRTRRNIEILVKYTRLEPPLLAKAGWPCFRDDGRINVESVLAFQEWGVKKGLVERRLAAADLWDPSFAEQATRLLDGSGG